jgi:hypothetical protein
MTAFTGVTPQFAALVGKPVTVTTVSKRFSQSAGAVKETKRATTAILAGFAEATDNGVVTKTTVLFQNAHSIEAVEGKVALGPEDPYAAVRAVREARAAEEQAIIDAQPKSYFKDATTVAAENAPVEEEETEEVAPTEYADVVAYVNRHAVVEFDIEAV